MGFKICSEAFRKLVIAVFFFLLHNEILKGYEVRGAILCGGDAKCTCRKTNKFYEMDCSNKSLSDFPTNIPSNVTKISLIVNTLKYIPRDALQYQLNLTNLYLQRNILEIISDGAFNSNSKMKVIDMTNNTLSHLPGKIFWKTANLKILKLSRNKLKYLPDELLLKTPTLKEIELSRNKLQELSENIFMNLKHLVTLILSRNYIQSLPPKIFSSLSSVRILKIPRNQIRSCDVNTFSSNRMLTDLDISHNYISKLPKGIFHQNTNLSNLDISFNRLTYLPENLIMKCTNLLSLHINENELSSIPQDFFRATPNISLLIMTGNKIHTLTKDSFLGLKSLHFFSLSRNNITALPADIFSKLQIKHFLDLSNNQITEIPDGLWKTIGTKHNIQYLLLQRNNLTQLKNTTFEGLQTLHQIFLNNNFIRTIQGNTFNNTGVQLIYLFENRLTKLVNDSFAGGTVESIHMYKNDIEEISETALGSIGNATMFFTCAKLKNLPWYARKVSGVCVHNEFVPNVTFTPSVVFLTTLFQKLGFQCLKKSKNVTCSPCKPGGYGNGFGKCMTCPRGGFYQDEIGSETCKNCSSGNYVIQGNGSSALDCKTCPEGTDHTRHAGFRACFCKRNYTRSNRFGLCTLCLYTGLNCTDDFKSLLPGYYWNWSFTGMNLSLYSSFVKNLLTLNNSYDRSTSEYNHKMPRAFKCPRPESCENNYSYTPTRINGNCLNGYRGWLCSKCQDAYYSVLHYCFPCQSKWFIISEMIITLSLCFLIIILVIWQNTKKRETDGRLFVDKLSSRMKIFLGFYQVVGDLYESIHIVTWGGPLRFVWELFSYVALNILKITFRPQCLNSRLLIDPIIRFKMALLLPIAIILVSTVIYLVSKIYFKFFSKDGSAEIMTKLKKIKSKLHTYVLLVLFITYQPTCDAIFEIYPGSCDTFRVDQEGNMTISLLRADYDINCESIDQYQAEAYIATAVYVIAFPFFLLILLRKYCRKSSIKRANIQCNNSSNLNEETPLINTSQKQRQNIPSCLNFLCENYKDKFWFWEILELGRKVGQTMLITLLGWGDALTKLFTIGTSVLFLTLHVKFSPMKSRFEQHLQLFSLTAIFLNILVAAVYMPVQYQATLSTLLILLDLGIVLAVAGEVFLVLVRVIRRKLWPEK
ncbi:uncharacterized protein [Apostichopus japonicus]|uniref:uncharacterized protein isoform X1 n=1 Tax=Stichopus japonicus TaxID=307972 RepID=UPI003AB6C7D8